MITDTDRLNWIQKRLVTLGAVTSDEFTEGTPPKLLRFYIEVDPWKYTGKEADVYATIYADARTLREAIDKAMADAP